MDPIFLLKMMQMIQISAANAIHLYFMSQIMNDVLNRVKSNGTARRRFFLS